jgi:hypothetical protein
MQFNRDNRLILYVIEMHVPSEATMLVYIAVNLFGMPLNPSLGSTATENAHLAAMCAAFPGPNHNLAITSRAPRP